jgi:hypothetical protein
MLPGFFAVKLIFVGLKPEMQNAVFHREKLEFET